MTTPTIHDPKVVDWCHGLTGGVKIRCSCGDWWVVPSYYSDYQIKRSMEAHVENKSGQQD